jgi:hypothetical protein
LLRLAGFVRLEHFLALVLVDGSAGGVEEETGGLVESLGALALEVDALAEALLEDGEGLRVDAAVAAAEIGAVVEVGPGGGLGVARSRTAGRALDCCARALRADAPRMEAARDAESARVEATVAMCLLTGRRAASVAVRRG